MNDIVIKTEIKIENLIYNIRGKQVMFDSDLAKLYQCKNGTKVINQAVKRNLDKFPEDFCFQLTEGEHKSILRSQNVTLELKQGQYSKYLPYVFTEEGVAMLASVLHTPIASKISIKIMRTFVKLRRYIADNVENNRLTNLEIKYFEHDLKIDELFDKLSEKEIKNHIYFNGQIYDSYSKLLDILSIVKSELIIIDGYADKTVLDMISKLKANVILITKTKSLLTELDIEKYNKQYNNLNIVYNDTFHDRYFIMDRRIIYHCGTSINHIGSKTFSINKLEDEIVIELLIKKIEKIINKK